MLRIALAATAALVFLTHSASGAAAQATDTLRTFVEASLAASPKIDHPHRPGDPPNPPGTGFVQGVPGDDFELTAVYQVPVVTGERGGFDVFNAVDPADEQPGADFVANVYAGVHGRGLDTPGDFYFLGDSRTPFYLGAAGEAIDDDFMRIEELQVEGSELLLHGAPADYVLVPATDNDGTSGTAVLRTAGPTAPDLIAFVRQRTLGDLEAAPFLYADPEAPAEAPVLPSTVAVDQLGGRGVTLGLAVAADTLGRSYVVGVTQEDLAVLYPDAGGRGQLFAAAYDAAGARQWITQFGSDHREADLVWDVATDGARVYATGRYNSPLPMGLKDAFVVMLDAETGALLAEEVWDDPSVQFGGAIALDDAPPGEGFVYSSGIGRDARFDQENQDPYLEKRRRSDLAFVERVTFGAGTNKEPWGGLAFHRLSSGEGRIYSAGWTKNDFDSEDAFTGGDVWLAAFDEELNLLWFEQWGSTDRQREWAWDLAVDDDGFVYVVGYTFGTMEAGAVVDGGDGFVTLLDPARPDGERVLWTRQLGTSRSDELRKVAVEGGSAYVAGHTYGSLSGANAGESDVWVGRFARDGTLEKALQIGSVGDDRAMLDVEDGVVHLAGYTTGALAGPSGGFADAYLARLPGALTTDAEAPRVDGSQAFRLSSAHPNPFSQTSTIEVQVPASGPLRIALYDLLGREVAVVADAYVPPGSYRYTLDAASLPSGVYLCRAAFAGHNATRPVTVVR